MPKQVSGSRADVLVGAGERHRRMNRQRDAAVLRQRRRECRRRWRPTCARRSCRDAPPRSRPDRTPAPRVRRREPTTAAVRQRRPHPAAGPPGYRAADAAARCRDAWEMALHATTTCSARSSATPRAVPTRPAEMIPTLSLAGRKPSNCSIADDLTSCVCSFQSQLRFGYRTVSNTLVDR